MSIERMWRQMPPAVFAPMLGFIGVALGWKRFSDVLDAGHGMSVAISVIVAAFFTLLLGAYVAKLVARPGVVVEELQKLPGRLGLAAASLGFILWGAHVFPVSEFVTKAALWIGIVSHLALLFLVVRVLAKMSAPERLATPAWHLTFVGFIAIPFAAFPVGYSSLGLAVFLATIIIAIAIYTITLNRVVETEIPAPQRPLQVIHLAPISLFTTLAADLGLAGLAFAFLGLATLTAILLLANVRWLTGQGFRPCGGRSPFPLWPLVARFCRLRHSWECFVTSAPVF